MKPVFLVWCCFLCLGTVTYNSYVLGTWLAMCSAALAHVMLKERLHVLGVLGCVLCVVGSTSIVLHAPAERQIVSINDVWTLATEPGFLI